MSVDLIRRAQAGDQAAFEALVRGLYDRLFATGCRILRDRDAAQDAVQDAVLRCWRDIRGLREPERFEAWLYRLLVNACRDQARRARRRPITVRGVTTETFGTADDLGQIADRDSLERAFRDLPVDQRAALVLTHYLGYPATEVAAVLGVPTGTVYSRMHRGSRAMRAALGGPPAPQPATTESSR